MINTSRTLFCCVCVCVCVSVCLCVCVCVCVCVSPVATQLTRKHDWELQIFFYKPLTEILLAMVSAADNGFDEDCGSKLALSFSNSLSTLSDASNIRNCISTLDSPLFLEGANAPLIVFLAISTDTSAAASNANTFSSIRLNASIEVLPVRPPSMSLIFCVDLAVRARTAISPFLPFASTIFFSSASMPSYKVSMFFAWESICFPIPVAWFNRASRRANASRANPSSDLLRASCAREYQSSACDSSCLFKLAMRRCVAVTSAYVCRTRTKSVCMSSRAWFMIFSGSSNMLRALLTLAAVTRKKRSKRFAWRAVPDAEGFTRSDGWVDKRAAEGLLLPMWTGANALQPGTTLAVEAIEAATNAKVQAARVVAVNFIVLLGY